MSSIKLLTKNILASFSTNIVLSKRLVHVEVPPVKNEPQQAPIVLLLGWLGSQDRHLGKYSKIYEDRGFTTVRYTAPVDALFFRQSKMWGISQSILKTIEYHQLGDRPIIVHTFSNGGAYCFRYILSLMQRSNRSVVIKGQIFDSGPCGSSDILHLSTFFNVLKEVIGKEKLYSSALASLGIFGMFMIRLVQLPFYGFSYVIDPKNWFDYDPYRALMKDPLTFPQLFLFSKEDRLMPYQDVEKFASVRRSLGVKVKCHCFNGSSHVSHYVTYPKLYTSIIDNFLNECLETK